MAQISCDKMQTKVAARKNVNTLDGSVGQALWMPPIIVTAKNAIRITIRPPAAGSILLAICFPKNFRRTCAPNVQRHTIIINLADIDMGSMLILLSVSSANNIGRVSVNTSVASNKIKRAAVPFKPINKAKPGIETSGGQLPHATRIALSSAGIFISIVARKISNGIIINMKNVPQNNSRIFEKAINISSGSSRNIDTVNIRMTVVSAKGFVRMVRLGNNNPIMTPDGINHVP